MFQEIAGFHCNSRKCAKNGIKRICTLLQSRSKLSEIDPVGQGADDGAPDSSFGLVVAVVPLMRKSPLLQLCCGKCLNQQTAFTSLPRPERTANFV